jgi:Uma2 family endonuclease
LISGEELARMGDLGRCELIDGRIVRMSPANYRHGGIELRIAAALHAFVHPRRLGRVLIGVRLIWVVDPAARVVFTHRSVTDVRELKEGEQLTGGDVLPGFEVSVAEIFEE